MSNWLKKIFEKMAGREVKPQPKTFEIFDIAVDERLGWPTQNPRENILKQLQDVREILLKSGLSFTTPDFKKVDRVNFYLHHNAIQLEFMHKGVPVEPLNSRPLPVIDLRNLQHLLKETTPENFNEIRRVMHQKFRKAGFTAENDMMFEMASYTLTGIWQREYRDQKALSPFKSVAPQQK